MWDIAKESRKLTVVEARKEQELLGKIPKIQNQEEIYWKQRLRLQWLQEGDENTRFFHAAANGCKNRNFIPCLSLGGTMLVDSRDIGKAFTKHFKQLFGSKRHSRFKIDFQKLFNFKSSIDLSTLEIPFSVEEIKKAVFELGG